MSKKKGTVSVLVRPKQALMDRLNVLADKHDRESANQIIVEIATLYTELWAETQEILDSTRADVIKEQWERMRETLKLPILPREAKAEGELTTKPQSHGRKRK